MIAKSNTDYKTITSKNHEAQYLLFPSEGAILPSRDLKIEQQTKSVPLNPECNSIQHQIQDKMASFITSLKTAQESILHVDDKTEGTLHGKQYR